MLTFMQFVPTPKLEGRMRIELLRSCGEFFRAIQPIADLINGKSNDADAFWRSVPVAVGLAANVSKTLWPIPKTSKPRGEWLRRQLGIGDDAALRSRSVRDAFEHLDERLERWVAEYPGATEVTRYIGPRDAMGVADHEMVQWYDTETNTLHVLGKQVNLQDVTREMAELQRTLIEQHAQTPGDTRYGW